MTGHDRPESLVTMDRNTQPLKHRRILFCMRVEKAGDGGFACVRFPALGFA
jgi:hypothetical protein